MIFNNLIIRPYKEKDRESIRRICQENAFMDKSCDAVFTDKEIFADFWTDYYLKYEPQSTFVAEFEGKIIGYVSATVDVRTQERIFRRKILPKILYKILAKNLIFKVKNLKLIYYSLICFLTGDFKFEVSLDKYPATFHINISKEFRNKNIGNKLLITLAKYLKKNNVIGVHGISPTINSPVVSKHIQAKILWIREYRLWKYLFDKKIKITCFVYNLL